MSKGLKAFFVCLGILLVFNVIAGLCVVPKTMIIPLSILATFIGLGLPIYALYRGADSEWSTRQGLLFLFVGIAEQALFVIAARNTHGQPIAAHVFMSLGQIGLVSWCLGAGALVAKLIKDKNLILPIAICLALLDIYFVMTPIGVTDAVMKAAPQILPSVALHIPKPVETYGHIGQMGLVGPADLLFIAMFFVGIHRFEMRGKSTVIALIPTLVAYLCLVIFFGWMTFGRFSMEKLPGLPPIAIVILLANWKEFKLNRDEKLSTIVLAVLALGLIAFGMSRPVPKPQQVEIIQQGDINPENLGKPVTPQQKPQTNP